MKLRNNSTRKRKQTLFYLMFINYNSHNIIMIIIQNGTRRIQLEVISLFSFTQFYVIYIHL